MANVLYKASITETVLYKLFFLIILDFKNMIIIN